MFVRLAIMAGIALSAALAAHVAFSAAAAYRMASYETRVFDVRKFPDASDYPALIGGYLTARQDNDMTVVAGSSFSFGYPWAAQVSFPAQIAAVNASIIGMGLEGVHSIVLCELLSRNIRPAALIVEVPLINEVATLRSSTRSLAPCADTESPSLFDYALMNAIGLQWADLLRDGYEHAVDSGPIGINPVPDGYFVSAELFGTLKDALRARMTAVYDEARGVSDRPFLFVTPVYIPGVTEAGSDANAVRLQFDFAESICIEIAGINCILTTDMLEQRNLYSNITHLGNEGTSYLAAKVRDHLSRQD